MDIFIFIFENKFSIFRIGSELPKLYVFIEYEVTVFKTLMAFFGDVYNNIGHGIWSVIKRNIGYST